MRPTAAYAALSNYLAEREMHFQREGRIELVRLYHGRTRAE